MKQNFPAIKERKIRIGLIGCGRISANHFGAILQYSDDFELVAVCDNDASALEITTNEYQVPGYISLTEMLSSEQFDATPG